MSVMSMRGRNLHCVSLLIDGSCDTPVGGMLDLSNPFEIVCFLETPLLHLVDILCILLFFLLAL